MFFIPYQCANHYMLIVIDLLSKSICYFDNVERSDADHANTVAIGVRDVFTDFADVMGHEEAADCVTFIVKEMKFNWTVNDDSLDCGLYLAYFMEQFQGSMDINPLIELADRRLYRATIITRILLSDLKNMDRDKLVDLAKQFVKEKPKRLHAILAARTPDPLKVVTPKKRTRACQRPAQVAPKRQRKNVPKKKTI